MKGRNIHWDKEEKHWVDEDGYLYYMKIPSGRFAAWRRGGRGKHLQVSHMKARMELIAKAKAGEITLEEAQAQAKANETEGHR